MAFDISDKWLIGDERRNILIGKIGDIATDGTAFKLWRMAFAYFKLGELVPIEQFDLIPNSGLFVEVGLAERRADGVYVKGSSDAFGWYDSGISQRREAGKKSAAARLKKFGSNIPINASNAVPDQGPNATHRVRTNAEREPNGAEPLNLNLNLNLKSVEEGDSRARGAPPSAGANANGVKEEALRMILGQEQNANVGRALASVPDEILADWRMQWTDESLRKTLKKAVNKLISREGSFEKVKVWSQRLTAWVESEKETLIRRPAQKIDQPQPAEFFQEAQPTAEQMANLANGSKKFGAAADVVARLAKQKAMPGKTA